MRFRLACVGLMLAAGCGGGGGPTLYQLKGDVTFDGKPVPFGRLEFEPDTTKGQSGGMGYADIVDGKYDTSVQGGRGVIGGPHVVHFTGMASRPTGQTADAAGTLDEVAGANAPVTPYLFSDFKQPYDLPAGDGTLNFSVPSEAAQTASAVAAKKARSAVPDP